MPKQYGGPGPRLFYPSAALSKSLSKCDALAQLLFDRMVTQADDQGRLIADPDVVRGQCIPLIKEATSAKVARWLGQLADEQMILIYEAEGHSLLQIRNWWEYQNGMRRAYPSRWEAPPGWEDNVFGLPSDARNGTAPPPQRRGKSAGKVRAQSPQGAGGARAGRPDLPADSPQDFGDVPGAPRARRDAPGEPNRSTYVRTEGTPLPPSAEGGDMLDEYRAWLVRLGETTRGVWREEALHRGLYLAKRNEGFTDEECIHAAIGVGLDPWSMGQNPEGIPHNDPAAVLRSSKWQTYIRLGSGELVPTPTPRAAGRPSRNDEVNDRVALLMGGDGQGQPFTLRALPGGAR